MEQNELKESIVNYMRTAAYKPLTADDLALARAAGDFRRRDARHHAVAVHRAAEAHARHEDVAVRLLLAHLGDDEAEALRRHG